MQNVSTGFPEVGAYLRNSRICTLLDGMVKNLADICDNFISNLHKEFITI